MGMGWWGCKFLNNDLDGEGKEKGGVRWTDRLIGEGGEGI